MKRLFGVNICTMVGKRGSVSIKRLINTLKDLGVLGERYIKGSNSEEED